MSDRASELGIDPVAGQALLVKVRAGKDAVADLLTRTNALAQPPKLGANPIGEAMAAKVAQRAAEGSGDSYADALRNLYQQYVDIEHKVMSAIDSYLSVDQDAQQTLARHS